MASHATATKISISVVDAELLAWAKEYAAREGKSLSALFTDAVRAERRLAAGRELLATWPDRPALTDEDRAAIRAEWDGGPRYEPRGTSAGPPKKAKANAKAKRRGA
jgi:hypothetical protein